MGYECEGIGYKNTLEMVQGFNGLKDYTADEIARALYGRFDDDLTVIYNTFAWYALEETAYRWGEYLYELEK